LKDTVNQYVYRIKGRSRFRTTHPNQTVLYALLNTLRTDCAPSFLSVVERFFAGVRVKETKVQPKDSKKNSQRLFKSLDDLKPAIGRRPRFIKAMSLMSPKPAIQTIVQLIAVQAAPAMWMTQPAIAALPNLW
jgi:hypothetical protein